MLINDLHKKTWELLQTDLENQTPFKNWDMVPWKMQTRYCDIYKRNFMENRDIVSLNMSQQQHTRFSFYLRRLYNYDDLVQARGGCMSDGCMDNLYLYDTKENLLEWLEFVRLDLGEKFLKEEKRKEFENFIDIVFNALSASDSQSLQVMKIPEIKELSSTKELSYSQIISY